MANSTNNVTVNNGTVKENGMENYMNTVFEMLTERFDGTITKVEVVKNNEKLTGFTFRKSEEQEIAPTLYPVQYYEEYERGEISLEEIVDKALMTVEVAMNDTPNVSVDCLTNWEFAKTKVMPMVVSKDTNEEMLKDLAYTDTDTDLAIIYAVVLGEDEDGRKSVKITNRMREAYKVPLSEIKRHAFANAKKQMEFKTMYETLVELMGVEQAEMMGITDVDSGMTVLSTASKIQGAGVMFVPSVLQTVAKKVKKETFYILPSSIHEVLVITMPEVKVDELKAMVMDVNATQVLPCDKLSDSVYFYNGKTVEKVA